SIGTRLKNWNTNPRLRRRNAARAPVLFAQTSCPSTFTVPLSGASNPPAMCRRVDLPAPDGPVTTTNSPASNVKSKSTSTRTCSSPLRYVLPTLVSCSTGVTLLMVTRADRGERSSGLLQIRLGPLDMSRQIQRYRHVAIAVPELRIGRDITPRTRNLCPH